MERKIALITGSNRGIGREVLRQLAEKGYHCILTSRKESDGQSALKSLDSLKDQISYHKLDVNHDASVAKLKSFVEESFGRLDVLVNNAGWNYDYGQKPSTVDIQKVIDTLNTNLMGPWRLCQAFIPLMKKQGFGRIVNVSSGSGSIDKMSSETPAYGLSKTALNVLTIKLADELKGTGILVNSVCPGWVRTEMGGMNAPRSVEEGADGIVWLATLPEGAPSGGFFRDRQPIPW